MSEQKRFLLLNLEITRCPSGSVCACVVIRIRVRITGMLGTAFVEFEAFNLATPDYGLILLKTIFFVVFSTMANTQFTRNSFLNVIHNNVHHTVWIKADIYLQNTIQITVWHFSRLLVIFSGLSPAKQLVK